MVQLLSVTIGLTIPEANHLLELLVRNEEDGTYSGPKGQYWTRARRILKKLKDAMVQR